MSDAIGEDFQRTTKYQRCQVFSPLDWTREPEIYKTYTGKKQIPLSRRFPDIPIDFIEILKKRCSLRQYSSKALSLEQLSFLLWASTGLRHGGIAREFRVAPSAGALYPIETYVLVKNVEALPAGIYHYNIAQHLLEQLQLGNFSRELAHAALDQRMCMVAPVVLVWTAVFERSRWKYKQRAYRYVYLDMGHVAQNLALSATAIGLGSCQIGAIYDDEVNALIGVDGSHESAIYLSPVGYS